MSPRDRHHRVTVDLLERRRREGIVVPVTVAVEVDYLLRNRVSLRAARRFLEDCEANRYVLVSVDAAIFSRARELDSQYADLDLGLVDGSVIAVAETLGVDVIVTLDHAHFAVAGGGRFSLIPSA